MIRQTFTSFVCSLISAPDYGIQWLETQHHWGLKIINQSLYLFLTFIILWWTPLRKLSGDWGVGCRQTGID